MIIRHETASFTFCTRTDRGAVLIRKADGAEVHFYPGDETEDACKTVDGFFEWSAPALFDNWANAYAPDAEECA
jgi:hypothetical protein